MKIIIQMDYPLDELYARVIVAEEKGIITDDIEEAEIAIVDRYINVADIVKKHPSLLIVYLYISVQDQEKWMNLNNVYMESSRDIPEVLNLIDRLSNSSDVEQDITEKSKRDYRQQ